MCEQWRRTDYNAKREITAKNRATGVGNDGKVKGTYRGGNLSQSQHMARKEQNAQGQTVDFAEVYKDTHKGLDDATRIVETYTRLMDERYPVGSPHPSLD